MIHQELREISVPCDVSVECDVCGSVYDIDDWENSSEFYHLYHDCGYASVFGDGNTISCDICQDCLRDFLGGVNYRVNEDE